MKLRARRRIGEISRGLEKAKANQNDSLIPTAGKKREVLAQAGLSTSVANRCEKLAAIPEDKFEAVIAKAKENNRPVTPTQASEFSL